MQEHQSAGFRKGVGWGSSGCWGGKRPRGEDPKFLHRQGKGEVGGLAGGEPGKQLGRRIGMGDGSARRLAKKCNYHFGPTSGPDPRHALYTLYILAVGVLKFLSSSSSSCVSSSCSSCRACIAGRPSKRRVTKPAAIHARIECGFVVSFLFSSSSCHL